MLILCLRLVKLLKIGISVKSQTALIVGAGEIAKEYVKILLELGIQVTLVCRDNAKASNLKNSFNIQAYGGGCEKILNESTEFFDFAINAVTVENLFEINSLLLTSKKVRKILTEKPGALLTNDFEALSKLSKELDVPLYIAYNRRYFSSTVKLKEILKEENPTSCFFEFTEWFWRINTANYSPVVINEWLLANSSHVIDLAFYLGNGVASLSAAGRKSNPHSKICDQYVGHGLFNSGAVFSYIADWTSAGRWKVEFSTKEGRYMLCPLEKLFFQKRGTLEYVEMPIDNSLDTKFKAGFYLQVKDFITDKPTLKSILDQNKDLLFFNQIKSS